MNPAEPIKTWLLRIFSPLLYQLSYPANMLQRNVLHQINEFFYSHHCLTFAK